MKQDTEKTKYKEVAKGISRIQKSIAQHATQNKALDELVYIKVNFQDSGKGITEFELDVLTVFLSLY